MGSFLFNGHYLVLLLIIVQNSVAPPMKTKESDGKKPSDEPVSLDELGLEYQRYLKEVVDALESDPEFRKKLETAEEADFRNGKIAAELEYVNHHVRTKLDELKRSELQRLRDLVKQAEELEKNEVNPNHVNPGHVDHTNPHTFESADLHKLITQVRRDLAEADRKRREEFKEYELQKQFEREQKVKVMDEEHKKKYLQELEEQKKKHAQHDPLHHPGSKAQLQEVWEKEDHMENQEFNPKTFFLLHDVNGDGYWDEDEVKALFLRELDKLYQAGVPEDDMREREEELERMREHVFKESDTNGDRLLSYQEFLEQTKKQGFAKDEGWETIDSQPQFTPQEYEEFERRRQEEIQRMIDQGLLQPYAPGMMPPPVDHQGNYQQYHPQQHMAQQYAQNMPYPPQQHGAVPQYAAGYGQYAPAYQNQVPHHSSQNPQGQHQQVPKGQHHQVPQGQHHQVPQGQHHQVPQGQHHQVPQGQHHQVPQGQHHQVPQGHQFPQAHQVPQAHQFPQAHQVPQQPYQYHVPSNQGIQNAVPQQQQAPKAPDQLKQVPNSPQGQDLNSPQGQVPSSIQIPSYNNPQQGLVSGEPSKAVPAHQDNQIPQAHQGSHNPQPQHQQENIPNHHPENNKI